MINKSENKTKIWKINKKETVKTPVLETNFQLPVLKERTQRIRMK